jgi:purine-binding chemotaxis protein CheW
VDTAALILPGDAGRVPDANALRHAAQFVVLDEGRWALACDSVTDVTQIKRSAVKWRTVAGRRPWLAGTLMNPMCALLDVDALITLLEGMVAR